MNTPKRFQDRFILGLLSMVPTRLVRHVLFLLKSFPQLADRWGYHVRPIHYYDPLPDFRQIKPEQTQRRRHIAHVDFDLEAQRALLGRLASYQPELFGLRDAGPEEGFPFDNEYFSGFDAAMYYALIRELKPARVVEIGSGFSTRIADRALRQNRSESHPGRLSCIEPFPEPRLTDVALEMTLIRQQVEDVGFEEFDALGPGDILFIDSSHTVRFGGDVLREVLEILPRLKPGVWIHFHDIFFPHDYPAEWLVEKRIAFNEQYLLEAFLAFNREFVVRAANYWLCLDHPIEAANLWPAAASTFRPGGVGCASFWISRKQ